MNYDFIITFTIEWIFRKNKIESLPSQLIVTLLSKSNNWKIDNSNYSHFQSHPNKKKEVTVKTEEPTKDWTYKLVNYEWDALTISHEYLVHVE